MNIKEITKSNRQQINEFIVNAWYSTIMVIRGKAIDMTKVDGFFIEEDEVIIGLITYEINQDVMEIISLDSLREKQGIGSLLLERVIEEARNKNCIRIVLITTNDNLRAIRFYQKRGFEMANLYRDALEISRQIKPEIPLVGEYGIPLRSEIEFEMVLQC